MRKFGWMKLSIGVGMLAIAFYIFRFPEDQTAWLTDWLYRLQEPVDGTPSLGDASQWRNVTIGLLGIVGGWNAFSGAADGWEYRMALWTQRNKVA